MYNWVIFFILGAGVTYLLVFFWWSRRRPRALCKNLPKWPEIPLLGNVMQLSSDTKILFQRLVEISETSEQTNTMFQVWFGPKLLLVASKPEDVKAITNTFIEKPYYYSFGKHYLGDGLVTASGEIWKRNIKKLSGTFTTSIVDGFQDVFNAQANKLVEQLSSEIGNEPFDPLHKYLAHLTLESVCQTALGVQDITQNVVSADYYSTFNRMLELLVSRGFNLLLHPEFIYRLTPAYQEYMKCVNKLHFVSKTVIQTRRRAMNEKRNNKTQTDILDPKPKTKFQSFIDVLMDMSECDPSLTDEQIRAEVDTIILGGQETTATTMLMALVLLGSHEDVQRKLREEVLLVFGDTSRPVEKEDLASMKYCEAVIMEVLRLYPPIPVVCRNASRDLTMPDGQVIPADTVCATNAWGAGRSRRSWGEDAQEFKPERWFENNFSLSATFLPFSYGRRSCIGKKYAMAILKTLLSTLIRNLRFKANARDMEFKLDIALRLTKGNLVTVHRWD